MIMKVRRVRHADVNAIYGMGRGDFLEEEWFTRPELRWIISSNPRSCWVLEDGGKLIGARLTCEAWGTTAWGWLVVIRREMRRNHLGTFLFDETCRLLKKQGMSRIMTDVYIRNKVSVAWHRKMGYRELGVVKDWFDKGKSAIIFCKDI